MGVNLDTTSTNEIVGIEILDASSKMDLRTILSYQLELDQKLTVADARSAGMHRPNRPNKTGAKTVTPSLVKSRR